MPSALKNAIKALKDHVLESSGRIKSIAKGLGTPGHRAAPVQTANNDSKIGLRLDNGETFTKNGKEYKRYKLQVNKNAENATLKKMAEKNSHKVHSYADVEILNKEPAKEDAKETVLNIFNQLERNADE